MKKFTTLLLLSLLFFNCISQQTNPSSTINKQDYLKKSKKQKTVAWILLGGGATLVLTGIIIPKGEITNPDCIFCTENQYEHKNDGIKGTLGFTGVLSMIGSIPFFISSKKNSKRAMSVSFKNETAPLIQKSSFVYKPIPSLSFKIAL